MRAEDAITSLRQALALSPENVVLRLHLAGLLLEAGRADEAETEYRAALALGADGSARLGLARAFFGGNKVGEALVLAESLLADEAYAAQAHVLLARILLNRGDLAEARDHYTSGVALDPTVSDEELARALAGADPLRVPAQGPPPEEREPEEDALAEPADDPQILPRPSVTFADVGGMESVKDEVRMKIVYPLTQPELFGAYGKNAGGGILLYGPPGCGKTHLARATAGEIDATFIAVGINEVLGMYIGESEQQLHDVFERARRAAPCVLFFDETDALGGRRADAHAGTLRQLVNQFLAELDGVKSANEGVLVLGATNAPWHVDDALRRPGRFDRVIFVPPPDAAARAEIVRVHLAGKPVGDVSVEAIVRRSEGFSGADLRAVVERAVEAKLRESMRAGVPLPLQTADLEAALEASRPTTVEWMQTARSYALHANQGGTYDDVLAYLDGRR